MSPRHGYLLLIPIALFALAVFVLALSSKPKPLNPLTQFAPCVQTVGGSNPMYACRKNRRAYIRQDGAWVDAGPLTPARPVPYSG